MFKLFAKNKSDAQTLATHSEDKNFNVQQLYTHTSSRVMGEMRLLKHPQILAIIVMLNIIINPKS